MESSNVSRYIADRDEFHGSEDMVIRKALKGIFLDRYEKAAILARMAQEAVLAKERGSGCSIPESVCIGQPGAKEGHFNKFDGAMTFIDAKGILRFRVCVDYKVEEIDQTEPLLVAHLEALVR